MYSWAFKILILDYRSPWEKSTGPKSPEGKAKVSRNADKGGHRAMLRELARLSREQGEALKRIA